MYSAAVMHKAVIFSVLLQHSACLAPGMLHRFLEQLSAEIESKRRFDQPCYSPGMKLLLETKPAGVGWGISESDSGQWSIRDKRRVCPVMPVRGMTLSASSDLRSLVCKPYPLLVEHVFFG
jgi:hypothetical protein